MTHFDTNAIAGLPAIKEISIDADGVVRPGRHSIGMVLMFHTADRPTGDEVAARLAEPAALQAFRQFKRDYAILAKDDHTEASFGKAMARAMDASKKLSAVIGLFPGPSRT